MKRFLIQLMIVLILLMTGAVQTTRAQTQAAAAMSVPVSDILNAPNHFYQQLKESGLDGIAWMIANQAIRSVSTSVVNWINGGFKGSPAFLTNPGAFFIDVADQVSGEFLAKDGVLAGLCSPFSHDIRLALALQSAPQGANRRYTCTLGSVIASYQTNPVTFGVNVTQSPNGATFGDIVNGDILNNPNQLGVNGVSAGTIGGFVGGDFTQGGWPALLSSSVDQQNNIMGAYLKSRSEIEAKTAEKQAALNNDLNRGRGFLSMSSCQDVTAQVQNGTMKQSSVDNGTISTRADSKTGNLIYEKCSVQTPGTIIDNAINTQIASPTHRLEIADEVDEVLGALFSQLVSSVLNGGLGSASGDSPSDPNSIVNQIVAEGNQESGVSASSLSANIERYIASVQPTIQIRQQILGVAVDIRSSYETARACWATKNTSQASSTDTIIAVKVTPLIIAAQHDIDVASSSLLTLQRLDARVRVTKDLAALETLSKQFQNLIDSGAVTGPGDIQIAQTDLANMKITATTLKEEAGKILQNCQYYSWYYH